MQTLQPSFEASTDSVLTPRRNLVSALLPAAGLSMLALLQLGHFRLGPGPVDLPLYSPTGESKKGLMGSCPRSGE